MKPYYPNSKKGSLKWYDKIACGFFIFGVSAFMTGAAVLSLIDE